MPRASIYCRVSSAEQVDNTSLATQEAACRQWCEKNGLEVHRVYVDAGESAKSADRPQFLRMVADCQKRKDIDRVVVYRLDRFARNSLDHGVYASMIRQSGATLTSVSEPITADPSGQLMESIHAALAQFDNDVRSCRAKDAMRSIRARGGWVHKAPYGFRLVRREDNVPVLAIDDQAAALIRRAYAMVKEGHKPTAIYDSLRPDIGRTTFYVTFRDPRYAELDPVAFQEVQQAMGYARPRSVRAADFPLRGHIICHHCGKAMTASMAKGKFAYYHCKKPAHASISANQVNAAVADLLSQLSGVYYLALPKLREAVDRNHRALGDAAMAMVAECKAKDSVLVAKMDRLVESMLDGRLPEGMYDRKRIEIDADLAKVRADLAAAQRDCRTTADEIDLAEKLMIDLPTMWNGLDPSKRAQMLRHLWPRCIEVDGKTVRTSVRDSIFGELGANDTGFFRMAPPTGDLSNLLAAIAGLMEVAA